MALEAERESPVADARITAWALRVRPVSGSRSLASIASIHKRRNMNGHRNRNGHTPQFGGRYTYHMADLEASDACVARILGSLVQLPRATSSLILRKYWLGARGFFGSVSPVAYSLGRLKVGLEI